MHTLTLLAHSIARHAHLDLASPHNLACHVHLDRSCTLWPCSSICQSSPPWPCLSHMLWPCSSTASGHTHLDLARLLPRLSRTLWPCLPIALLVMHNSLFLFVVCLQPLKPMLLCLHIFYTHDQKTNKKHYPPKTHTPPSTHTHTQKQSVSKVISQKSSTVSVNMIIATKATVDLHGYRTTVHVFFTPRILCRLSLSPLSNCSLPQTWTKEERRQNCLDWPRGCKRSGLITTERVRWNAMPQHHRSSKALKSSKICKRKAKGVNKQTCSNTTG